jgi:hypothetical protein
VSLLEIGEALADDKKYQDFECEYDRGEGDGGDKRAQRDTMELLSFGKRFPERFIHSVGLFICSYTVYSDI